MYRGGECNCTTPHALREGRPVQHTKSVYNIVYIYIQCIMGVRTYAHIMCTYNGVYMYMYVHMKCSVLNGTHMLMTCTHMFHSTSLQEDYIPLLEVKCGSRVYLYLQPLTQRGSKLASLQINAAPLSCTLLREGADHCRIHVYTCCIVLYCL